MIWSFYRIWVSSPFFSFLLLLSLCSQKDSICTYRLAQYFFKTVPKSWPFLLPTLSLLFRNNLLFGWEKLFFNLIWSIALRYLLQTEFFIHFHLSEFQLKPIIIAALIILSFKHFYFHSGIIGYLIVKDFFYDSVFLNRVLWPSNKKKMFFTSSLLQLYQETSLLNDINVSEYCSLENHLSLFHPQANWVVCLKGFEFYISEKPRCQIILMCRTC